MGDGPPQDTARVTGHPDAVGSSDGSPRADDGRRMPRDGQTGRDWRPGDGPLTGCLVNVVSISLSNRLFTEALHQKRHRLVKMPTSTQT